MGVVAGACRAACLALLAGACGAPEPDLDLTHAGACPFHTAAAWQGFLDGAAENDAWVKTCDADGCDSATYHAVETAVAEPLAACAALLADNPPIAVCADRLRRFTASWLQQHDLTSYGFTSANDAYFAAQTGPDVPLGTITPPAALLSAMPDLAQVIAAARAHGFPYLIQTSGLGNVRFYALTADPAGRFDQWTVMNLRADTPSQVHTRVSFLAVQKTDAAGAPLPAVRLHFRDLLVEPSADGGYQVSSDLADNAKCYSCHPSGVRQLVGRRTANLAAKPILGELGYPGDGPPDFAFQRLGALDARLASYGLPDWSGQIVVADHGPALGAEQGCTQCHDGHARGVLTVSTSGKQLQHMVSAELAMPPTDGLTALVERRETNDPPLTAAEAEELAAAESAHAALLSDLEAARAPALRRWLLATGCE